MKKSKVLIFGVIALREARFWFDVVEKTNINKKNIFFISFCSISTKFLRKYNYEVFCIYDSSTLKDKDETFRNHSDPIFLHESLTFIESKKLVFERYKKYFLKFNFFLKNLIQRLSIEPNSICVIQELGAFSPVIALFDSSKYLGIKHFFLEPSVLTAHTFILENTLDLLPIKSFNISAKAPSFDEFLNQISDSTQIASKDILNLKNNSLTSRFNLWLRFFRKLKIKLSPFNNTYYDRLLASIFQRFKRYLSDFLLGIILPKYEINKLKNFAYYPLHSDIDFALTVRNSDYLNQFNNLISLLNKNNVVIKQHPARSYTFRIRDIFKLFLQNNFNSKKIFLANSKLNSLEISSKALFTYYISSKAGIFAELKNLKTRSPVKTNFKNSSPEELYNEILSMSFNFDLYDFSEINLINTKIFLENIFEKNLF